MDENSYELQHFTRILKLFFSFSVLSTLPMSCCSRNNFAWNEFQLFFAVWISMTGCNAHWTVDGRENKIDLIFWEPLQLLKFPDSLTGRYPLSKALSPLSRDIFPLNFPRFSRSPLPHCLEIHSSFFISAPPNIHLSAWNLFHLSRWLCELWHSFSSALAGFSIFIMLYCDCYSCTFILRSTSWRLTGHISQQAKEGAGQKSDVVHRISFFVPTHTTFHSEKWKIDISIVTSCSAPPSTQRFLSSPPSTIKTPILTPLMKPKARRKIIP